MTVQIPFDAVADALDAGGSTVHAAEAHGCLVGALCARRVYLPAEWIEELLPEAPEKATDPALTMGPLNELFEQSRAVLEAREMEFEPLLPPDEASLVERVEALGAWAQGFLYGFGAAGPFPRGTLPGDVAEVLSDIAEVSRAGAVGSESAEVEETALAELIEFLRVGAQLIYDELTDLRATQTTSNARH
jgi:yecA family protein